MVDTAILAIIYWRWDPFEIVRWSTKSSIDWSTIEPCQDNLPFHARQTFPYAPSKTGSLVCSRVRSIPCEALDRSESHCQIMTTIVDVSCQGYPIFRCKHLTARMYAWQEYSTLHRDNIWRHMERKFDTARQRYPGRVCTQSFGPIFDGPILTIQVSL